MQIINTGDPTKKPPIIMLVYGEGGVGKTTFASTAPKPLIADCENGSKYFGLRGIKTDVALIQKWSDMKEYLEAMKNYETAVIDPIGELMDMLKRFMTGLNDSKLVQKDGSPTMAGWGYLKKNMRDYLKVLKNSGKNVLIVAHLEEQKDEERIVKRPKIETKLSDELVNMVDIVGYFTVLKDENGEDKRVILVDPTSDKYTAKDRTGQLGKIIPPDFSEIIEASQGTKIFKWSKEVKVETPVEKPIEKPVEKPVEPVKAETVKKEKAEEPKLEFNENDSLFNYTMLLINQLKNPAIKRQAVDNAINSGSFNQKQIDEFNKLI